MLVHRMVKNVKDSKVLEHCLPVLMLQKHQGRWILEHLLI